MFREPEFGTFYGGEKTGGPLGGGDVGWKGIRRQGTRGQDSSVHQGREVHCFQQGVVLWVEGEDWGEMTEGWSFL